MKSPRTLLACLAGCLVAGSAVDAQGVTAPSIDEAIYDVKNPFRGPTEHNLDGWVGYSRKLFGDRIRWSAQLNVKNIGVGNRLIPVSAQPDGTYDTMRIAEPQTWTFSSSFEF